MDISFVIKHLIFTGDDGGRSKQYRYQEDIYSEDTFSKVQYCDAIISPQSMKQFLSQIINNSPNFSHIIIFLNYDNDHSKQFEFILYVLILS